MDKLMLDGTEYKRYTNKWLDDQGFTVSEILQDKLNKAFADSLDLSHMSVKEMVAEGDRCKESSSYYLAIKYYETAAQICDQWTLSYILPRITSCFRKRHAPQRAIDLFSYAKEKYGTAILSSALLTSAAAAYCDMEKYEEAEICCKHARIQSQGEEDENLKQVIWRIRQAKKD